MPLRPIADRLVDDVICHLIGEDIQDLLISCRVVRHKLDGPADGPGRIPLCPHALVTNLALVHCLLLQRNTNTPCV